MTKRIFITLTVSLFLSSTLLAKTSDDVSNRQLVMDDGYTFFRAEPVKARNPKNTGDIAIGWYLVPKLRLMGSFPDNSGFRLVVKQKGNVLSKFFCVGRNYRKATDRRIRPKWTVNAQHDDFMDERTCSNKEKAIKQIGQMDVEIYYVDGDTDEEKLVRKHKIDVHKVRQIKGYKGSTYAGVNEYFIQRFAEASIGIIHTSAGNYFSKTPYPNPSTSQTPGRLTLFMPYSPEKATYYRTYIRCSVNGTRIKIERDSVQLDSSGRGEFVETALLSRNDPRYRERITFTYLKAKLPITLKPGKWECSFLEAGETYRTIRFAVGPDNKIVPHPEQKNGNINLFHNTYMVDVEIPAGGAKIDGRSVPMPNAGVFYGIPWSTPEGKAAAAKVPKKGKPYPVMPR